MSDPEPSDDLPLDKDVATTNPIENESARRFCLRCLSPLEGDSVDQSRCQDCGLAFNPSDDETYSVAVRNRWKFWFPGLCLAISLGVISYGVTLTAGDMGLSLFVGVPVSIGAILGYATRVRVWGLLLLAAVAIPAVVTAIVSTNMAGIFCGATLGLIFCIPVFGGLLLGYVLRIILKGSSWDQRVFLPVLLIAAAPPASAYLVSRLFPHPVEIVTVETEMTFAMAPELAWNRILFYEEVEHEPPWLLKLSLPRPVRTEGSSARVGDVKRCVYEKGHLSKRITHVDSNRRLEFVVVEQELHFERDVTLIDGGFELKPDGDGNSTHVTLRTRYQRHLSPRWVWEPIERNVVRALHQHVMEGMRRNVPRADDYDEDPNLDRSKQERSRAPNPRSFADHGSMKRTGVIPHGGQGS